MSSNKKDYGPIVVPDNFKEWKTISQQSEVESPDTGRLFEALLNRLDSADKYRAKLGEMAAQTDTKVATIQQNISHLEKGVEDLEKRFDGRTDKLEKKLDEIPKQLRSTVWMGVGTIITVIGIVVGVIVTFIKSPEQADSARPRIEDGAKMNFEVHDSAEAPKGRAQSGSEGD